MPAKMSKREEYRRYLHDTGVIDFLSEILVKLANEPQKPTSPIDYIRENLGASLSKQHELEILQRKIRILTQEKQVLLAENEFCKLEYHKTMNEEAYRIADEVVLNISPSPIMAGSPEPHTNADANVDQAEPENKNEPVEIDAMLSGDGVPNIVEVDVKPVEQPVNLEDCETESDASHEPVGETETVADVHYSKHLSGEPSSDEEDSHSDYEESDAPSPVCLGKVTTLATPTENNVELEAFEAPVGTELDEIEQASVPNLEHLDEQLSSDAPIEEVSPEKIKEVSEREFTVEIIFSDYDKDNEEPSPNNVQETKKRKVAFIEPVVEKEVSPEPVLGALVGSDGDIMKEETPLKPVQGTLNDSAIEIALESGGDVENEDACSEPGDDVEKEDACSEEEEEKVLEKFPDEPEFVSDAELKNE